MVLGPRRIFKDENGEKLTFKEVYNELPDASGQLGKRCNIIDKALLQAGLLRQCAYTMYVQNKSHGKGSL